MQRCLSMSDTQVTKVVAAAEGYREEARVRARALPIRFRNARARTDTQGG